MASHHQRIDKSCTSFPIKFEHRKSDTVTSFSIMHILTVSNSAEVSGPGREWRLQQPSRQRTITTPPVSCQSPDYIRFKRRFQSGTPNGHSLILHVSTQSLKILDQSWKGYRRQSFGIHERWVRPRDPDVSVYTFSIWGGGELLFVFLVLMTCMVARAVVIAKSNLQTVSATPPRPESSNKCARTS